MSPTGLPAESGTEEVRLRFEEYEAIRLIDHDGLTQAGAAEQMGISRPTCTRIYNRARKLLARALVEARPLSIGGGRFRIMGKRLRCSRCRRMYDGSPTAGCPYCNNGNETSKTDHTMKKIALPTRGTEVDDHFGHCECYTIFTLDDNGQPLSREIVPAADGCGCKSDIAPRLHAMGVTTLLAGNMGDGAKNVLQRNGIAVIRGCHGPLETVVEAFVKGMLADSGAACAHHHDGECHHAESPSGSFPAGDWHLAK